MSNSILTNKHIILGVTGSIAAYKACALASQLTQAGALVDVIMTESATRFVSPLTFQSLTGRPAYTTMWQTDTSGGLGTHIAHVGLGHGADLLLIAPITANTLAKIAYGLADDLLSVTALAARCPILVSPAMDVGMYEAPATQANIDILRSRGVHFAGPGIGRMASGLEGLGRFIEPEEIIGHCRRVLGIGGPLAGRRVVVTAGPTREPLDPVRYLSNYSSGKQGFAIAQAAVDAGAEVTLIAGPVSLPAPVGAERIDVTDTRSMLDAVLAHATGDHPADALIMAAAVADFRPATAAVDKIKKEKGLPQILMEPTIDILQAVGAEREKTGWPRRVIGFAAESRDLLDNAAAKLQRKKLDMIVANDISRSDAGFEVNTNKVTFLYPDGTTIPLPKITKEEVAEAVIDRSLIWFKKP
jgi:phosphopantothenoylcysteine decarboxylase/phosphopantothenate--cysteine ligase